MIEPFIKHVTKFLDRDFGDSDADAYIRKYDDAGILQWERQFGMSDTDERSNDVSTDGLGNVYIAGTVATDLGDFMVANEAFVAKYDANGTRRWIQFSPVNTEATGVSADGMGGVYVTGKTYSFSEPLCCNFIAKYDANGALEWFETSRTLDWPAGPFAFDYNFTSRALSADGLGNVYLGGSFIGIRNGGAFVMKFTDSIEHSVDFDGDGVADAEDVDTLVAEIIAGSNDSSLDLTADGVVNINDLNQWLSDAATANGFAEPYSLGDANLDGTVDASDLNALGRNWQGRPNSWQLGDFNADGIVNAGDLNQLGQNWLTETPSAASQSAVPEPATATLAIFALAAVKCLRRRTRGT